MKKLSKRNILIGLIILTLILIAFRVIFIFQTKEFKVYIDEQEQKSFDSFIELKEEVIAEISGDSLLHDLFVSKYNINESIKIVDTTCSFIYFKDEFTFKRYDLQYLNSLEKVCKLELQNKEVQNEITENEIVLKDKYPNVFEKVYQDLKYTILIKIDTVIKEGEQFFGTQIKYSYNTIAWKSFDELLFFYSQENSQIESVNMETKNQFENQVTAFRRSLNSNTYQYYDDLIEENLNAILLDTLIVFNYNLDELGNVELKIKKMIFNQDKLNEVNKLAQSENYKYNSLYTGAMPYSNCYGSGNFCNGYCSQIKIKNNSGDMVATVKNSNSQVVRHAYIRGNDSYTFNLSDGSYQVFFYHGVGWNPYKIVAKSKCGDLKGGFVSNESFTKGDYERLTNQVLTYSFTDSGYWNPKSSSKDEAF